MQLSENDAIVFNRITRDFVPFRINQTTGEVIIKSGNIIDNEDNCIVTTWNNIYLSNMVKKEKRIGKKRV